MQTKEKNSVFIAISIHWEFHQIFLCKGARSVPGTTAVSNLRQQGSQAEARGQATWMSQGGAGLGLHSLGHLPQEGSSLQPKLAGLLPSSGV